jgi:hypothetical protein
MILAEDWGGMFSDPLRNKLSPKGSKLYQSLLKELSGRKLWDHKNLGEISRRAKKLLREADSTDSITREGRALLRKEARENRLLNLMLERIQLLKERSGTELSDSVAGKLVLMFAAIDAIRRSLRTLPRFLKR